MERSGWAILVAFCVFVSNATLVLFMYSLNSPPAAVSAGWFQWGMTLVVLAGVFMVAVIGIAKGLAQMVEG